MSKKKPEPAPPAIVVGRRYRYRLARGVNGVLKVAEIVRKANGFYVIGHDRKSPRGVVEVRAGGVFPLSTFVDRVAFGPPMVWPRAAGGAADAK